MRKTTVILSLLILITSCHKEPVEHRLTQNYTLALDTLQNYDDYIFGYFDNKFLVSTDAFSKSYSASVVSNPPDSSHIQFGVGYRSLDNNLEKSTFVAFRFLEPKTKLDPNNHHRYKSFTDFIDFFNRKSFQYFQRNQPVKDVHNVWIMHQNHYDVDNDVHGYASLNFDQKITSDNFYFLVDSLNVVEAPKRKVMVYYSFQCIGVNFYGDQILLKNGKGKSTFEFH